MLHFEKMDFTRTEDCAALVQDAFRGDPLFSAVAKGREKPYAALMDLFTQVWLNTQTTFAATEDGALVGAAIVGDADSAVVSVGSLFKFGAGKVLLSCGVGSFLAFLNASGQFDRAFDGVEGPKHYLTLLAVAPAAQGSGIGSALVQSCVLPHVRQMGGKTLCLNTNRERNRGFYRKNGFTQTGTSSCRINGRQVENWSYQLDISVTEKERL